MRRIVPFILSILVVGLTAGCAQNRAEVRQFEVRVDEGFHTVTETRPGFSLFGLNRAPTRTVRVNGTDIPCAELPCAAEVRAARGEAAADMDEFRAPPPDADLTTE
jgi:endonuclease YncB( thermonuclease family)